MSSVREDGEAPRAGTVLNQSRESLPPDGQEDEELDPRVQIELDRLNVASEDINRHEKELGDLRSQFKRVSEEMFSVLTGLKKSWEKAIRKAHPYFDARHRSSRAHIQAARAAQRYEKAFSMHKAAREMVARAEANVMAGKSQQVAPGIISGPGGDAMAWMEVLNHATLKVMSSEKERRESELHHMQTSALFAEAQAEVQKLYKDNKRSIEKAKPYFEGYAKYFYQVEEIKKNIDKQQLAVVDAKASYKSALETLEIISNQIHESRNHRSRSSSMSAKAARQAIDGASSPECGPPGERTDGVGAAADKDDDVDVDAVMEKMTSLRMPFDVSASAESLDGDGEDEDDSISTPSVLSDMDRLEMMEADSLATATSLELGDDSARDPDDATPVPNDIVIRDPADGHSEDAVAAPTVGGNTSTETPARGGSATASVGSPGEEVTTAVETELAAAVVVTTMDEMADSDEDDVASGQDSGDGGAVPPSQPSLADELSAMNDGGDNDNDEDVDATNTVGKGT